MITVIALIITTIMASIVMWRPGAGRQAQSSCSPGKHYYACYAIYAMLSMLWYL